MLSAASRACNSWRIFSTLSETHSMGEVRSNRAEELEKRLNDLTSELEKERKERMDLRDKLGELTTKFTKHKLAQYKAAQYDQQRLRQLQQSPETPQKLQQSETIKPVARSIDELTTKLAAYTTVQHRQKLRAVQQTPEKIESAVVSITPCIDRKEETVPALVPTAPEIQLQPPEKIESATDSIFSMTSQEEEVLPTADPTALILLDEPEKDVKLHEICDPTNIFQAYRSSTPGTIPLEQARSLLQPFLSNYEMLLNYCPERESKGFNCKPCETDIRSSRFLIHFFSEEHRKKGSSAGENVSLAAVEHWLRALQKAKSRYHQLERPEKPAKIAMNRYLSNILQLCHSNTSDSIPFEIAKHKLLRLYEECDDQAIVQYRISKSEFESIKCEICDLTTIANNDSIHHFFSKIHTRKARASGGNVSLDTVNYWERELSNIATRTEQQLILPEKTAKLHEICHPTNVLQLCHSDTPNSIPIDVAIDHLKAFHITYDKSKFVKYCMSSNHKIFDCEVCDEIFDKYTVLYHFFNRHHLTRVRVSGGNVSLDAVKYWLRVLQEVDPSWVAALPDVPSEKLHEICHPTNIFQLCRSNVSESMSYYDARELLLPYWKKNFDLYKYTGIKKLACDVCKKTPAGINHFFTQSHERKVWGAGASVSLAAVNHWLDVLQKVAVDSCAALPEPAAEQQSQPENTAILHEICHPTNIFQLCRTDTPESIPFGSARDIIRSALHKCDKGAWKKFRLTSNTKLFECEVCEKTFEMPYDAINHFCSRNHALKACNANVSLAAVNHWMDVLHKKDASHSQPKQLLKLPEPPAEAPQMQQLPAAVQQSQPKNSAILNEICHPTNVLQLYHSDTPKTIPFESARDLLQPFFAKCYEGEFARYCHATEKMIFSCKLCEKDVSKYQTPFHFLTKEHIDKARASAGNVSLTAVKYWLFEILQVYSSVRPELQQQSATQKDLVQSDPSAAATTTKELMKEEAK